MTTPADLAADAARRARKTARRQGIMLDAYVEPAATPSAHLIKLQHEAAQAQLEHDAAVAAGELEAEQDTPAEDEQPKSRRRSSAKAS